MMIVIKKKFAKQYAKWKTYDNSFNSWINANDVASFYIYIGNYYYSISALNYILSFNLHLQLHETCFTCELDSYVLLSY